MAGENPQTEQKPELQPVPDQLSRQKQDMLGRRLDIATQGLVSICDEYGLSLETVAMAMTVKLNSYGLQRMQAMAQARAQMEQQLAEETAAKMAEKEEESTEEEIKPEE